MYMPDIQYNTPSHLHFLEIFIISLILTFAPEITAAKKIPENNKPIVTVENVDFDMAKIPNHPRIIANDEDFKRIRQLYENKSNEYLTRWIDDRLSKTKDLLDENFDNPESTSYIGYFLYDGVRTNAGARMLTSIKELSFAYKITGDSAYAQKVWYLLKRAGLPEEGAKSNEVLFPDWYPKFFLDLSAMATAYAIGYDWCYDFYSEKQKTFIEHTIIENGLNPGFVLMTKESDAYEFRGNHNRNAVKNTGIILAALSVADNYPDLTSKIVRTGIDNIQFMMPEFAPDGAWFESLSYWSYTMEYFIPLVSTLIKTLGDDFGLLDYCGLRRTAEFALQATGPLGANNYHDGGELKSYASNPAIFWLAKYFGDAKLTAAKLDFMVSNDLEADIYDILWYDSMVLHPGTKLERDAYFGGIEFVSMRQEWDNPESTWVSFHGGQCEGSHAHIDGGAFVFDACGVRWACDVRKEDYNIGGYRSYTESKRTYYRVRTEGHNTLVINPDKSAGQELDSYMKIIKFVPDKINPYSVLDMSGGYKNSVYRAIRGFMLADNRNSLIIRDELELKGMNPEIFWFMHTRADAVIAGKNKVMLFQDGKKLELEYITNSAESQISVVPAESMPSSPPPFAGKQSDNSTYRKVQIRLTGSGKVNLTVKLKPESNGIQPVNDLPISKW
jgi:hypothetical protein